jgi:hypothetical protein
MAMLECCFRLFNAATKVDYGTFSEEALARSAAVALRELNVCHITPEVGKGQFDTLAAFAAQTERLHVVRAIVPTLSNEGLVVFRDNHKPKT